MKSKGFIQITGFFALSSLVALSAACAFAASSEDADFRPVWMADQAVYSQNSALLYSDQNPSFMPQTLSQQMLSNHAVQDIEQQYLARTRDYDMRKNSGIATTVDEGSYVSDVTSMGKSMYTAARMTPLRQYQQGFHDSASQGGVSKPVAVVGTAVALGSGTPIPIDLGDDTRCTWVGDLLNQHGELNLVSPFLNAHVEMNMKDAAQDPSQPLDPTGDAERYKVSVNREVAFQVTSSVTYGSSSSSFAASLSRPIISNLSGSVNTTRPVGESLSGSPAQVAGGLSYGLTF